MLNKRFAFGAALLAAAVGASAFVADYAFVFTPKVGTVTKYKMQGVFDFEGQEITFMANTTNKVIKVLDNGNYVVEENQTDAKVVFGGQEMDAPTGGPTTSTFTADGRVVEIMGDMVDGSAYRTAMMASFFKPTKPVAMGSSWTVDVKGDDKLGSVDAKATYTVEAEETIGAWKCVRVKYDVKETKGQTPAGSTGKVWISLEDGEMVKVDGVWKDVPVPGAPAPINGKMTVTRQ